MQLLKSKYDEIVAQHIHFIPFQPLQEDDKIKIMRAEVDRIVDELESSLEIKINMSDDVWLPLIKDLDIWDSINKLKIKIRTLVRENFMDETILSGDHIIIKRKNKEDLVLESC